MNLRRLSSVAALSALLLLVTAGCMKADMDITIHDDETWSGEMTVLFHEDVPQDLGQTEEEFMEGLVDEMRNPEDDSSDSDYPFLSGSSQATEKWSKHRSGEYLGARGVAEDQPLDAFCGDEPKEACMLKHEGNRYVFRLYDKTEPDEEEFEGEFRFSLTFPGDVISSNGDEDGNTVSWEIDLNAETMLLEAEGEDTPGYLWLWILLSVLAVLVVAAAVITIVLVRRRRARAALAGPATYPAPAAFPAASPASSPTSEEITQPLEGKQPQQQPPQQAGQEWSQRPPPEA